MVDGGPESVQMVLGLAPNEFYIVVYIYMILLVQVEANFEFLTTLYATFASMGLPKYTFFKAMPSCKYT